MPLSMKELKLPWGATTCLKEKRLKLLGGAAMFLGGTNVSKFFVDHNFCI